MIGRLFLITLALLLPAVAVAQQRRPTAPAVERLTFQRVVASAATAGQPASWIAAQGPIAPDSGEDFEAFIKANPLGDDIIQFDSTGGSIVGALKLGYALRKARARVSIGRTVLAVAPAARGPTPAATPARPGTARLVSTAGVCYSSCAYAFLGGVERSVPGGAAYGVHMFWPGDQLDRFRTRKYAYLEIERVHRLSAQLAIFLQKMGIDAMLLDLAARTPPRSAIRILTPAQLRAFNIVTNAPPQP